MYIDIVDMLDPKRAGEEVEDGRYARCDLVRNKYLDVADIYAKIELANQPYLGIVGD